MTLQDFLADLEAEDLHVQLAAMSSLGGVGRQLARCALYQCLNIEDETLMDSTRQALVQIEFNDYPLDLQF